MPALPRFITAVATALAGLVVLTVAVVIAAGAANGGPLTKGPIPSQAIQNGAFDKALIPDFIPALDRNGQVAGYVAKDLAIADGAPTDSPIPVYAADLTTLVGHMYSGRGFVPLGTSPDSVPVIPATVGGDSP
jgi:hypothetical protein